MSTLDGDNPILRVHSRLGAAGWRLMLEPARGALGQYEKTEADGKVRRARLFMDDTGSLRFIETREADHV